MAMTKEEKFDAVSAFCDKYEEEIEKAPENSTLGKIRLLDDAWTAVMEFAEDQYSILHGTTDERVEKACDNIVDAMLFLAQLYLEEDDINAAMDMYLESKGITKTEKERIRRDNP